MTVVHQLLSGAGPHDAITTEAGVFRAQFREWGWGGADHAHRIHPALDAPIAPAGTLAPAPEDVVILHHSAGWPSLEAVMALPGRKLLLYHNITPPAWFWVDAPGLAAHCQVGHDQLQALVSTAAVTAADSGFNAAELSRLGAQRTEVIPLLLDAGRLGAGLDVGAGGRGLTGPAGGAPQILFVGRLSPHKRQDEVIRAFGLYRRRHAPAARLTLVGDPISAAYVEKLRGLAEEHAPGAVRIASGLAEADLARCYREADLFLCPVRARGLLHPAAGGLRLRRAGDRPSVRSDPRGGRQRRVARPRRGPGRRGGADGAGAQRLRAAG